MAQGQVEAALQPGDEPYQCFLTIPPWINVKRQVIPQPIMPPRPPARFRPFTSPFASEATVNALRATSFAQQFG
jgi:hypothetical protein